jgi:hypothetical protein
MASATKLHNDGWSFEMFIHILLSDLVKNPSGLGV